MNSDRMIRVVLALLTSLLCAVTAPTFADEPQTLKVWPGEAPGASAPGGTEQATGKRVTGVTDPTLTVFRPEKEKDTGVAVIVCPGGGYTALMMDYEGEDLARWLNTIGVTGIVLTKLDGTAKGGVAVAIAHDLKLPIRYVGVGEGIDDLIPFSAQDYVDALFQEKW